MARVAHMEPVLPQSSEIPGMRRGEALGAIPPYDTTNSNRNRTCDVAATDDVPPVSNSLFM